MAGLMTGFENKIDSLINSWVTAVVTNLTADLIPLATAGFTVYLTLLGWQISRGEVQDSVAVIVKRLFFLAVIGSLALTAGYYSTWIQATTRYVIGAMIGEVSSGAGFAGSLDANGNPISGVNPAGTAYSIGNVLDAVMTTYKNYYNLLSQNFTNTWGWPSFSYILSGLFVAIAMFVVLLICGGFYLLAKIELALCLAIGPIFILLAAFESTREWTRRWIGQLWHYAVQIGLLAAVISMLQGMLIKEARDAYTALNGGATTTSPFSDALAVVVVALLVCVIAWNIGDLARALTGAVGSIGHGAVQSAAAATGRLTGGAAWGATKAGGRLAGRGISAGYRAASEARTPNRISRVEGASNTPDWVPVAQRGTMDVIEMS